MKAFRGWLRRFVTVFISGLPFNFAIGGLLAVGLPYYLAAPSVVVSISAVVASVLSWQEGQNWQGWWRRFLTVSLPGIPINFSIAGLLALGYPFWESSFFVLVIASLGVATLLSAQEGWR